MHTPKVVEAFRKVERHLFIPQNLHAEAYADHPLPIGCGQNISAPHMVAIMTELLEVEEHSNVLEVGCGSGYQAAILSEICGKGGVVSVEYVPQLAERAGEKLRNLGYSNVKVVWGDGTLGYPEKAPYDRIIVTAAAPKIPKPLVKQLSEGGRMLIPVGGRQIQTLVEVSRIDGKILEKNHMDCVFVPLVGEEGWK
ncbi:MAG TPA: protein-L-isoaspartate(D-aspartate) O-methyltransferase [Candidatus Altiarchaeales archaeon]|nr:protein-L-isoaspartate(D-aspartate) O-methyltransferase [Candidatus Altiarchaeales archaeon]